MRFERLALAVCSACLLAPSGRAQCLVSQDQILLDPAGEVGDSFGDAIAISGDLLVVGSWRDDDLGNASGSVSVFRRQGTNWVFEARLTASNGAAGDYFGRAVAVESAAVSVTGDDLIVVGSPRAESVYFFRFDGVNWIEDTFFDRGTLLPFGGNSSITTSEFGEALDLSGDVLVVGSRGDLTGSFFARGRAFVFRYDGSQWVYEEALQRPGSGTAFAREVATNGEWIFASNHAETAVSVFRHDGTSWIAEPDLVASQAEPSDSVGWAMDVDGDLLIVGAFADDSAAEGSGLARIYRRSGSSWQEEQRLIAFDTGRGDLFGGFVALDGDTALIGANGNNVPAEAYVFRFDGTRWDEDRQLFGSAMAEAIVLSPSIVDLEAGLAIVGASNFGPPDVNSGFCCGAGGVFLFDIGQSSTTANCPQPFCFGDGGIQTGCTPCPCANDAPTATRGGCLNSDGHGARLHCRGSLSVSAADLRFEVEEANPDTFGVLVSSNVALPANPANPCFGLDSGIETPLAPLDGLRCVGGTQFRHGPRATDSLGSIGAFVNAGWGGGDNPPGGLIQQGGFAAGETRYWQVFYREEIDLVCMNGSNTTNGVRTLLEP